MADISSGTQLKGVTYGLYSPDSATGKAVLDDVVVAKFVHFPQAAVAMGSGQTETAVWANNTGRSIRVLSVGYATTGALTASDTNNKVLTLSGYAAAGTGKVTVATATTSTTGTGTWVAFTVVNIPVTAANVVVASGGVLSVTITEGMTGVALPAGAWVVKYEYA